MVHEIVFDSASCPEPKLIGLASGHISLNRIVFSRQNISVTIEARTGAVEFFDLAGNKLLSAKAELPRSGDEKFSEVRCGADDGQITLGFPRYSYKDNYPNCDGEYDRWTKIISGFTDLCYDVKKNSICE